MQSQQKSQDAFVTLPFHTRSDLLDSGGVQSVILGGTCYNVRIPSGTRIGQKLRLKGIAGQIASNLEGGDIHLIVCPDSGATYQFQRDVQIDLPLSRGKMNCGSLEQILVGHDKFDVKVPPGVRPGLRLRLRGLAEQLNGGHAGDVLLRLSESESRARSFWGMFNGFDKLSLNNFKIKFSIFIAEFEGEWRVRPSTVEVGVGA